MCFQSPRDIVLVVSFHPSMLPSGTLSQSHRSEMLKLFQCTKRSLELKQGSHRLGKYFNLLGFLEKSMKIKSVLTEYGKINQNP